ncbi:MAG TPA: carboxypeptidase regulatory-like domain-containing protein, partial [Longimicrobiales bacterium]|nr:carboxypeptidase regulatory-like domain-containing protein [Longimicrobiales bacterium]
MRESDEGMGKKGSIAAGCAVALLAISLSAPGLVAQGVTTGALSGFVVSTEGQPLEGSVVLAVHTPSGTRYSTLTRATGAYSLPNMRVGGPYTVSAQMIGHETGTQEGIVVQLGQTVQVDFDLVPSAVQLGAIVVTADQTLNADRTGAATFVEPEAVAQLPSVRRSTRDLIRTDPRNDGNFSFAGRNWLFNNVSLDGSYFSNPFGLDDPAPGGQANAEPIPFEAVEQVQVSVAPFDVRQGGFTGANVNTVTKSGTNDFQASAYTYYRNESLIGNQVRGQDVIANPDLGFNQSGFTAGGPIQRDKLFFFLNGELERRDDPGSDFVADTDGDEDFGESRVSAATMDAIRDRMISEYGYDPGPYQGYIHETNSNKLLAKLDWNVNEDHNVMFRYSYLDASREQGPHPFVLSFNNAGRGPNAASLPFQNSGYRINNRLNSFALEVNSRFSGSANHFFASYNRFRDFREPFSRDFPTVEIGEEGVGYTTLGHEPFSIHNILDQDVLQLTNNFTLFRGRHDLTFGSNFEWFGFFNSFNIFRHGVFFLPASLPFGSTFSSVSEFLTETEGGAKDFDGMIGSGPFKGENIDVGQLSFYAQDEFRATDDLALTLGLRVDLPMYFTDPVDNQWSRDLTALDGQGNPETVDQSSLPGASPLFSPRVGFNWDVKGDRSTQIRGGTGIFTGRIPFVWFGNVVSNPGANPDVWGPFNSGVPQVPTSDDAVLQQSFDLNAMDPDFKWPQVWVTDIAVDQRLPGDIVGTLELIYGNDINGIIMRNADLVAPVRTLADGRPYYGGFGANELNDDGGAGIYVIDNIDEGYNVNVTAQLRKTFSSGLSTSLSYSFTEAKNALKSTEIASVLWQNQPVQ